MSDVIDLQKFKNKKLMDDDLVRNGRTPLYVSHATGKITGGQPTPDFGDRLARIRASLEKINRLMAELKEMSNDRQ